MGGRAENIVDWKSDEKVVVHLPPSFLSLLLLFSLAANLLAYFSEYLRVQESSEDNYVRGAQALKTVQYPAETALVSEG